MAEFLTTNGISQKLEEIIRNSGSGGLWLISPYLKFNSRIKGQLEDQAQTWKTAIRIVYGKTELRPKETEWLVDMGISTSYLENLHSKCYMNDSHALITSMNLYEFSQVNNAEMGILVSAEDDPELYQAIKKEAEFILRRSQNVKLNVTLIDGDDLPQEQLDRTARSEPKRESASVQRQTTLPKTGFCLRCGSEIPCSLERPYCNTHYRSWARYKNEDYEEKLCHTCGAEHSSSMAKPVCLSCYRKYRSAFRNAS